MTIQRNTFGYRDPQKAMSIKALQDRAAKTQAAMANVGGMEQIEGPWTGGATALQSLAANISNKRAMSDEADARQALAALMTKQKPGEYDPNLISQIGVYDEELANALRKENLAVLDREDTQAFTAGESQLTREQQRLLQEDSQAHDVSTATTSFDRSLTKADYDAKIAEAKAKADAERQIKQTEVSSAVQEPTAKINLAERSGYLAPGDADSAARDEAIKRGAEARNAVRTAEDKYTTTGDIETDYQNGAYGPPGSPRAIELRDRAHAAENLKGTPTPLGSKYAEVGETEAAKRHNEIMSSANDAATFKGNIERLKVLGAAAGTGKLTPLLTEMSAWTDALGIGKLEGTDEAQAYQAIVDKLAPNMRAPGSGASSDTDVKMFLSSLPSLSRTPEGNALIIETFQAIEQAKIEAAKIIAAGTAKGLPWYEIDNQINAMGDPYENWRKATGRGGGTGDPNAADPLGLGGGGGGGAADPNDPLGLLKPK